MKKMLMLICMSFLMSCANVVESNYINLSTSRNPTKVNYAQIVDDVVLDSNKILKSGYVILGYSVFNFRSDEIMYDDAGLVCENIRCDLVIHRIPKYLYDRTYKISNEQYVIDSKTTFGAQKLFNTITGEINENSKITHIPEKYVTYNIYRHSIIFLQKETYIFGAVLSTTQSLTKNTIYVKVVIDNSVAAVNDIRENDIILELNHKPVLSVADFNNQLVKNSKQEVTILINRNSEFIEKSFVLNCSPVKFK